MKITPLIHNSGKVRRRRSTMLPLTTLLFVLSSCTTSSGPTFAPTSNFDEFVAALVQVQIGTKQALSQIQPLAQARFSREVLAELGADNDAAKPLVGSLQLKIDPTDPLLIQGVPYYLIIPKFDIAITQATNVLIDYAKLLQKLADPDLVSPNSFDQLKTELNTNAISAAKALDPNLTDSAAGSVSVISDLAASAIGRYLSSKRSEDLIEAIKNNQPTVDDFSQKMQSSIDIIGQASANEYNSSYNLSLSGLFVEASRMASLDTLMTLNENQVTTVSKLLSLKDTYSKIPAAHSALAFGAGSSTSGLSAIITLVESGNALKTSYEQAAAANRTARVQAEADKASAAADAMEANAKLATLRSFKAKLAATRALLASQNDPNDTAKASAVSALDAQAKTLEEIAKTAAENAATLRIAALQVQTSASAVTAQSSQ